ncbi:Phosphatidylcholine-sterol acyltransferase (Lecithin-cholesterol acyltransferase)/ Phospholipase A [Paragonimus heterotremus]|uniref:Phosphatidylcholine-sterol acyltransferase (Lecithin-cholesterol acyltransferase)/ Phospholipase A n=1 Tax=Paragonimus heterotremus TaxID=100268 RepID=A0A8J4WGX7_9TREM|nr:Phosphatidylcholine-sterol acyltransferase (Lecithin-cholesterol acyltransferase)/ Phospholipase A [Paragonimus heterotremus]
MCTSKFLFLILTFDAISSRPSDTLSTQDKHPVILIPGNGGSRAYYRSKTSLSTGSRILWLALKDFLVPSRFTDIFGLKFDRKLNKSYDNENYEITFPGWGETYSVEYLDEFPHVFGDYFHDIVNELVKDPFFKRNISVHGAPYDFRRAPNENQWFQKALTQLIEDTYQRNGLSPVVLVAHSMGNLYTHSFLRAQTSAWKKKYVKAYIAVSAPFGGCVKVFKTIASGENMGAFIVNPLVLRGMERSFPSLPFMAPDPRLWSPNETIIITPKRNYTVHDNNQFYEDLNYTDGYYMMEATKAGHDFLESPTDVELYCVYGTQVATMEQVIYTSSFPDELPKLVMGDGDGTVNLRSLEVCRRWNKVNQVLLPGAQHRVILQDKRLIQLIQRVSTSV